MMPDIKILNHAILSLYQGHASLLPGVYPAIGFRGLAMWSKDPDGIGHTVWLDQRTA